MMSNTTIDWTQPLEAVNCETGEVVPVALTETDQHDHDMSRRIGDELDNGWTCWFREDGTHMKSRIKWTIRNVATPAEDEFGPEIKVDGKPAWLEDSVRIKWRCADMDFNSAAHCAAGSLEWAPGTSWAVTAIRLPANHPHYRTHSPATPTLSLSTGVDKLERYEGFLRRLAGMATYEDPAALITEARGLVAEMPELPDPDLVKAREIVADAYEARGKDDDDPEHYRNWAQYCRDGSYDDNLSVVSALAGIKAGKQMGADNA